MADDKKHTHEAFYKKENVTSTSTAESFVISAQGQSSEEALEMFKKIKEMMEK